MVNARACNRIYKMLEEHNREGNGDEKLLLYLALGDIVCSWMFL